MRKLLLLPLFLPLATLAQITSTKVLSIQGVGNANMVSWAPAKPTSPRLLTVIQFPGNGEAGTDPTKAYVYGPQYFTKNTGFAPQDMQFIFAQTPYFGGTYGNPIAGAFLRAVIQYVKGLPNVDTNKIFLTGLSYGADHLLFYMQKEDAAHYIPIAGIIPMSMAMYGSIGNSPNDQLGGNDIRFNKTHIYGICGNADPFLAQMVKFNGYATDPTRQANPANPVKLTEKLTLIVGNHTTEWNKAYDPAGVMRVDGTRDTSIYDWMRARVAAIQTAPVTLHARLWVDSLVIHYPNTSVLLIDSSTGSVAGMLLHDSLVYDTTNDVTGRFSPCDLRTGILLSNLVEGTYKVKLVEADDAGHLAYDSVTIKVYGPPKCSAPRTVTSIQVVINGLYLTIPVAGTKIGFSDGSTQ